MRRMQENTDQGLGITSDDIIDECMVRSALESTELALDAAGREPDHPVVKLESRGT